MFSFPCYLQAMNYARLHAPVTSITRNASPDAIGMVALMLNVAVGELFEDIPADSAVGVGEVGRQQQYAAGTKRRCGGWRKVCN